MNAIDLQLPDLTGLHILIVEDEFIMASVLKNALGRCGAKILGPAATLDRALALVETADRIDGAVLDINLRGAMTYPVADVLARRRVPFVFATGYDADIVPEAYRHVPRCEKPVRPGEVARILSNQFRA
jgi:CheY-like chemotaxis protein